jgi:nucleoporin GLE1
MLNLLACPCLLLPVFRWCQDARQGVTAFRERIHVLPRRRGRGISSEDRPCRPSALYPSLLDGHASDRTMPARNSNDDSLASRLSRSHISTTSSAEDLTDTEATHKAALAAAQAEHQRVRESALRAYSNNVLRQEHELLRRKQIQELERLKLESERAELAARLQELQRKKITVPAPRAPSPPPPRAPTPKQANPPQKQSTNSQNYSGPPQDARARPPARQKTPPLSVEPRQSFPHPAEPAASRTQSFRPPLVSPKQADIPSPSPAPNKASINSIIAPTAPTHDSPPPHSFPGADKYLEIHKRLKQIRAFVTAHAKQDPGLKKKMGEMRREIRKSVGQLTEGRGANRTPVSRFESMTSQTLIVRLDEEAGGHTQRCPSHYS